MSDWPFGNLTMMKYGLILADFPWEFETYSEKGSNKSPSRHYDTMSIARLKELPIGLLASGDCVLVLWSTWDRLSDAMMLMKHYGFTYKTGGVWAKRSKTWIKGEGVEKWAFSTGYMFRGSCEPFIVGTIGSPERKSKSERNLIEAPVREHSRKPGEMHRRLERLFPNVWRCELFARKSRKNWDVWGNQVGLFDSGGSVRTLREMPARVSVPQDCAEPTLFDEVGA